MLPGPVAQLRLPRSRMRNGASSQQRGESITPAEKNYSREISWPTPVYGRHLLSWKKRTKGIARRLPLIDKQCCEGECNRCVDHGPIGRRLTAGEIVLCVGLERSKCFFLYRETDIGESCEIPHRFLWYLDNRRLKRCCGYYRK